MEKTIKATAINGSPRKRGNTSILLQCATEGVESAGAEVNTVHLYDLNFRGCISCFACKRKETYQMGRCAMRDDLTPVLEAAMASDILLMGSPIYLSDVSGAMRSFWERLLFMNAAYDDNMTAFKGSIACGVIYTMNVAEDMMKTWNYPAMFETHIGFLKILGGKTEYTVSNDTYQFDDYAKYHAPIFDEVHKAKIRTEQFPKDCEAAFHMGARLAGAKG